MASSIRVYRPRGARGGGGVVAQVTIDEETVQRWLGPVGAPSAIERLSVGRAIARDMQSLQREVVVAFEGIERERAARIASEGAGGGGGGSETAAPAAPAEFEREGSGSSAVIPPPGVQAADEGSTSHT